MSSGVHTDSDSIAGRLVGRLVIKSLARSFRRIGLLEESELPRDRPLVLYANHHGFHDGYVLWYLIRHYWKRVPVTWMEEWDRYPIFAAIGAYPFPKDDLPRRIATIRKTVEKMNRPDTVMFYFPEGVMHPPEEGLLPFDRQTMIRYSGVLPSAAWVPTAIKLTSWGDELPSAVIRTGHPHDVANGSERSRLEEVYQALGSTGPEDVKIIFDGKRSSNERWDLSVLRRFFDRYI